MLYFVYSGLFSLIFIICELDITIVITFYKYRILGLSVSTEGPWGPKFAPMPFSIVF